MTPNRFRALCTLAAACQILLPTVDATAEEPAVSLVLYSEAESDPALEHPLLPTILERLTGNAAVYLGKVKAEQTTFFADRERQDAIIAWQETPLEELRRQGAAIHLSRRYLRDAACCTHCDWQLPIGREPYALILLPEVQECRQFGRILAAQARIDIAHGRFEEAIHEIQTCLAVGRHVATGETLVNSLVGNVMCIGACRQLRELVQQPGAPNLYWSLTSLPSPLVDFREGLRAEVCILELTVPELQASEQVARSPEESRALLLRIAEAVHGFGRKPDGAQWEATEAYIDAAIARVQPLARQEMLDRGASAENVADMSDAEIVLVDFMARYRRFTQDGAKVFALPYPQAMSRFDAIAQRMDDDWEAGRDFLPMNELQFGYKSCRTAQVRLDRAIAVLRLLEALRIYAAAHEGQLPATLADIVDVPVPVDPVTDQPFVYSLEEGTASLGGPPVGDEPLNYRITMRHAKRRTDHSPK